MLGYIIAFVLLIVAAVVKLIFGDKQFFGHLTSIHGGFMDADNIPNVSTIAADSAQGIINYKHLRNILAHNIHEEIACGTARSPGQVVVWDVAGGLSKNCTWNKKGTDAGYKLTYKLRDYLTTTYIRSLEDPSAKRKINARYFALTLLNTFNKCLDIFIAEYNKYAAPIKSDQLKILYKGGNVIAIYTRYLYRKIDHVMGKSMFADKIKALARGDWDYNLYIDSNDPILHERARTFVLYMLQEIKKYLDTHEVFNMPLIASKLAVDMFRGQDVPAILAEYKTSTHENISIENVNIPGYNVTRGTITATAPGTLKSRYSMKRDDAPGVTDSFEVNTLVDPRVIMQETQLTIGFTEGLRFLKTYLASDFDLARVKINNVTTMNIDGVRTNRALSADIIDMSFINPGDTKSANIHHKVALIGRKEFTTRRVDMYVVPFLTPHYLFYDLCNMIIEEGVYPWDDKKYVKRLDRLITMGVLSASIVGGVRIKQLIKSIDELINVPPELAYVIMNKYTTITPAFIIEFSVATDHFSYELLKSIYKSLIFDKYSQYVRGGEQVPTVIDGFTRKYLKSIFDGDAEASVDMLKKPMDAGEYAGYIRNIADKLKVYSDIPFDKLQVDDKELLNIGDL